MQTCKQEDKDWGFNIMVMWATAFTEVLTELLPGQFKDKQVLLLKNGTCCIDDARICMDYGLCSCKCRVFMHYVVCMHVLTDAMLKGSITSYPPNFNPRNIGSRVCRLQKVVAGQQLGFI